MNETPAQKRKRLEKRDKYRGTICAGCRHNYYNFPKKSDGVNAGVEDDYSCWNMEHIKRGKCSAYSR